MSDATAFRDQFPVFERVVYMNSGTEGPVPRGAAEAVRERLDTELLAGRAGRPYFEATMDLATRLRAGYAAVLGCEAAELALTGSTTDGINTVIGGLDLRPGDEVLTSDEEHPGLLAPLGRARRRQGITVRVAPFDQLVEAVGSETRLIAVSHVSWVGGKVADVPGLVATGVPVLLDAAQGIGAIPVDVHGLGVDFYAASGQKWLCGPEGSGCLYVRSERIDDLLVPWPGYGSLAEAERALDLEPASGAARFDHGFPVGIRNAWALASLGVFEAAGWDWVHDRAATLADRLATRLSEAGREVLPRGRSTLVAWRAADHAEEVARLAEAGIAVRNIPAHGVVRASVGAWSSEADLDRLLEAVGSGV